tara:strand:- start:243 stop:476 length:234 start_codon:yes stop_codon:yes gene_type:complete
MNKKHTLDLKDVDCPLSFIKTRKFLKQQPSDTKKYLLINSKKTLKELSITLEDLKINFYVKENGPKDFVLVIDPLNI